MWSFRWFSTTPTCQTTSQRIIDIAFGFLRFWSCVFDILATWDSNTFVTNPIDETVHFHDHTSWLVEDALNSNSSMPLNSNSSKPPNPNSWYQLALLSPRSPRIYVVYAHKEQVWIVSQSGSADLPYPSAAFSICHQLSLKCSTKVPKYNCIEDIFICHKMLASMLIRKWEQSPAIWNYRSIYTHRTPETNPNRVIKPRFQ